MREETDRNLVDACLGGNERAWDALVERYGRLVYSIPRRLGLGDNDSDDIFQVVFGIVLRRLETLRDVDRLSAWLIRTTYREAYRLLRRRSARQTIELPDTTADDAAPTDEQVATWERQALVRAALHKLDPKCRELLQALYFHQASPSYEEIAASLDMKIGSIGPTRARCLQKLEKLLPDLGGSPPV